MTDEFRTNQTRKRYNRLAPYYDLMEALVESWRFAGWRSRLREKIQGTRALEVGVGTGKNMPYYPAGVAMTAIDLSPRMLKRAGNRAKALGITLDLKEMDVQALRFPDKSFDTVFATFVFCSVPDPILGLNELYRVCKPNGRLLLLEHMRPGNRFLGMLFDALNPFVVRMMGANINRRTLDNTRTAGWNIAVVENLSSDVVRWIEATP
jgi:phosphatidylethanolamine/phosphatidyl-N-methylethanolamine N-methyltransferase